MKCEKCGAQLPENETLCPECGTENAVSYEIPTQTENTTVRAQTVPQRPRTAYPDRRADRRKTDTRRKGRGKVIVLVIVIAALLCAAFYIGYQILQNGQEEPNLGDPNNGIINSDSEEQNETINPTDEDPAQTDSEGNTEPTSYDLAGVWVWDSDTALMKETIWDFGEDGSLTIYYFGLGNPENPFESWPIAYTYDKETATLTLAEEDIVLSWQNETSFSMNSEVLGICDARKTDEEHIPTGALDIREVDTEIPDSSSNNGATEENSPTSSVYIFEDSDSRYLSRAECEAYTAEELRIARNEIYARHGRLFDSEDLQEYFESQDWYEGTLSPDEFDYTVLNDYERYNVNLMKSIEDEMNNQ